MKKNRLPSLLAGIITIGLIILGWRALDLARDLLASKPAQVVQVGPTILEQVRRVNKQIFVEHYLTTDVSYAETPRGWLQPLGALGVRQEYVVLLRGRVPAGIDLSQVGPDDIWVSDDGRRAQLTLPAPRIFEENVSVDLANSRILANTDTCPGFLCPTGQLEAYRTMMEPAGRARLIRDAEAAGIRSQAAIEAQAYYEQLLNALGIAEVRVVVTGYTRRGMSNADTSASASCRRHSRAWPGVGLVGVPPQWPCASTRGSSLRGDHAAAMLHAAYPRRRRSASTLCGAHERSCWPTVRVSSRVS